MSEKRYAIVRVDEKCPSWCGDNPKLDYLVCNLKDKCPSCRYGDTKDQLVAKIMTAFTIAINENKKGNMPTGSKRRRVAEIIVEFLGVED